MQRFKLSKDEVEAFIEKRFPRDSHWKDGNCYWFAHILVSLIENGRIVYDMLHGHFLVEDKDYYYDYDGAHLKCDYDKFDSTFILDFDTLKETDNLYWLRLVRDCVL